MLELEIKGTPLPWAAHKGYGKRAYDPRAKYKTNCRIQLRAKYKEKAIDEAVRIHFYFYLPFPKSFSEKKKNAYISASIPHTSKPDIDNLTKAFCDTLKGIVIADDNLVVEMSSGKYYSVNPRIVVRISKFSDKIYSKL